MSNVPYTEYMSLIGMGLTTIFFAVLIWLVNKIFDVLIAAIIRSTQTNLDNKLAPIFRRLLTILLLVTGLYFLTTFIRFSSPIHLFISRLYISACAIFIAVAVGEVINTVMHSMLYGHFKGKKESVNATLPFINNVSRIILYTSVALFIMWLYKIDITPALASAGVVGVALAFAAKDFIANVFGGISVFFDRPYTVGDYVIIADKYRGEVLEIGMRSTRIKTRDNVMLTVPNSVLITNAIINESGFDPRLRIRLPMQISYHEDVERVEQILLEVAHFSQHVLKEPKPLVRFREFGDSGIKLELLVTIAHPGQKGFVMHELLKLVNQRFKSEHISIPYPQRDIHVKNA